MSFDQFQQHVEAFLGRQISIELVVGLIRLFETAKDLNDSVHARKL